MNEGYMIAANGIPMLIFCSIIVAVVLIQPIIFSITARRRAQKIGMTTLEMNKVVKSSAIFSILPSIPVLASYLVLVPAMGKYFPWMRLSVVGSVTYETAVASMAANAFGFENIYNTNFPADVFFSILLVLTIGILGGNFFNLFFLKTYDKTVKKIISKNAKLLPVITSALFIALFCVLSTPHITNSSNPVGIISFVAAGAAAALFNKIAAKKPKLKEYSFSISLIVGMVVACLVNPLFA